MISKAYTGAKSKVEHIRHKMLICLIIRLDSVRGVDSGVKDCRKSVIKKMTTSSKLVNTIVSSKQILGVVDEVFDFKIGEILYRSMYLVEVSNRYFFINKFWLNPSSFC